MVPLLCDCEYLDKKDKDENGQPKKKRCDKGFDKLIGIEFHRETHHNVGRCSVCCDYCNKLQQSVHQKQTHHQNCSSRPNKDGAPTHWCDQESCGYSCRTTQSLNKHMATDHPTAIGLAVAGGGSAVPVGKNSSHHRATKGTIAQLSKSGSQERGECLCLILVGNKNCDELH